MRQFPLAHPLAVAAVFVLVVNDHVLKRLYPGMVTGKLSDVTGMIFFPLLLATLVMLVAPRSARGRVLLCSCIATALVFSLTKTTPWANELYRVTWGTMQWPLRAVRAWIAHRPLPGIAPVVLVRDPSDLVAVPFVFLAYRLGVRTASAAT